MSTPQSTDHPAAIRRIAIVGGGTAGWLAASVLARALPQNSCSVVLVESAQIGTIGVGEATIPPIVDLLHFLGIDLVDFVARTQATFKLGIKFRDWRRCGHEYWHPFGTLGSSLERRPFYHYWQQHVAAGGSGRVTDYSLCASLGEAGKFRFPDPQANGPAAGLRYALHFDASLVVEYLRAYALQRGVTRLERTVVDATRRPDGFLDELLFQGGERLQADLFIDCSGFRAQLMERILGVEYLGWSAWLPCDRAVAFPTRSGVPDAPYTLSAAHQAGWRWRIPLQHRVGNGSVYASSYLDDQVALDGLMRAVDGPPLSDPRQLRFVPGRRREFWNRNCVALGLASGFLEPLESTSIHLVMSGIYNLLDHFPDRNFAASNIRSYNSELAAEIEQIRDFIILHYCATERADSPFWHYCRSMEIPATLQERLELYRACGRLRPRHRDLFTDLSWFFILDGLGITPATHDPLVDATDPRRTAELLRSMREQVAREVRAAASHPAFLATLLGTKAAARAG
jgi:tryptophan 7-halogenase